MRSQDGPIGLAHYVNSRVAVADGLRDLIEAPFDMLTKQCGTLLRVAPLQRLNNCPVLSLRTVSASVHVDPPDISNASVNILKGPQHFDVARKLHQALMEPLVECHQIVDGS